MSILEEYEKISKGERFVVFSFDTRGSNDWHMWERGFEMVYRHRDVTGTSSSTYPCSGFKAHMGLDMAKFIRYYVPSADILSSDSTDGITDDSRKALLDAQSDLHTQRVAGGIFK